MLQAAPFLLPLGQIAISSIMFLEKIKTFWFLQQLHKYIIRLVPSFVNQLQQFAFAIFQ